MNTFFGHFHFMQPAWFWLLIPLVLIVYFLMRQQTRNTLLDELVDPALAPYVLSGKTSAKQSSLLMGFFLAAVLAIIALASPAWNKEKRSGVQLNDALVVAMDLSTSMYATDVKPNRLARAQFELIDFLKSRKEGQTGFVVYAGAAFVVSPLTNDTETIIEQTKTLTPDIMPIQGARADFAIQKSVELIQQSGLSKGRILLITDEILHAPQANAAAKLATSKNITVSVLAVGTEQGAPIDLPNGGFLKDNQGKIVVPRANVSEMRRLAENGKGIMVLSRIDDQDLRQIESYFRVKRTASLTQDEEKQVESWENSGIWLALLLIPLLLPAFRKGYLFSLLLGISLFHQTESVWAQDDVSAWNNLWRTPDQQAQKLLQSEQFEAAAERFKNPKWKASAYYLEGDYDKAAQLYTELNEETPTADSAYNLGTALLRAGQLEEAEKVYEQALERDPDHADTKHNLEQLRRLLKENKNEEEGSSQEQQDDQSQAQDSESKNKDSAQNNQQENDADSKSASQQAEQHKQKNEEDEDSSSSKEKSESEHDKDDAEKDEQSVTEGESKKENEQGKLGQVGEDDELDQSEREQMQAVEQWLRRIPDDPAGLWKRKFQYQYRQQGQKQNTGEQQW